MSANSLADEFDKWCDKHQYSADERTPDMRCAFTDGYMLGFEAASRSAVGAMTDTLAKIV